MTADNELGENMERSPGFIVSDPRGVSPVIGVILMVAITVVLASVIGVFVLGFDGSVESESPQSAISVSDHGDAYEAGEHAFRIEHQGGEPVFADQYEIVIRYPENNSELARLSAENSFNESGFDAEFNGAEYTDQSFESGDVVILVGYANSGLTSTDRYRLQLVLTDTNDLIVEEDIRLK